MDASRRLTDGQVVTLLVGLGLDLLPLHQADHGYGPIHPAHISLGTTGRPRLADVAPPPAWTPHDDWVALIRLGRFMGATPRAALLSWEDVGLEGLGLLTWLMRWATPEPLPPQFRRRALARGMLPEVA